MTYNGEKFELKMTRNKTTKKNKNKNSYEIKAFLNHYFLVPAFSILSHLHLYSSHDSADQ